MGADVRKELEKELLTGLKAITSSFVGLKASKNKIVLLDGFKKLGEIYIHYLTRADGYYAGVEISECDAMEFCLLQSPPYNSRLLNSSFLSKTSLSERGKEFGDEFGGIIRMPAPSEMNLTARKIEHRLTRFYLSRAENCLTGSLLLINDVLLSPDDYAFPFLTVLFAAKKNGLTLKDERFQRVLNAKKIFGNKYFDLALTEKILS